MLEVLFIGLSLGSILLLVALGLAITYGAMGVINMAHGEMVMIGAYVTVLCGIWLAIGHLISAIAMAITVIGIPLALANLKLIPVSLMPLGKEIVPVDGANAFASPGRVTR